MKNKLIFLFSFLVSFGIYCQVKDMGGPRSFGLDLKKSASSVIMPSFDINKINAEDAINDLDQSKPYRFGYSHKVDLGLNNAGEWYELANGDRLWLINIISKGAKTMNFIFDTYQVPHGASVYIFNNDRTDVLGAYTNVMNRKDQMLGTWMVEGDNIWIEYYEPSSASRRGQLNIEEVVHGYRSVTDVEAIHQLHVKNEQSGNCNHDVNCTVGDDFDFLKERLKHSVAQVIMGTSLCSGGLINNTKNDRAPYFLTARHCDNGPESTWAFRFNWISPYPVCGDTQDSPTDPRNQTTSGATRLALNIKTDVRLLRLDGGIDPNWDVEWAGWDRTDNAPDFTVGIHHPRGDIMKVCRDDDAPQKIVSGFNGADNGAFWSVSENSGGWEIGVTEKGSSGSPLFDDKGRIIGQLGFGSADCIGIRDNNGFDGYGRFSVSWDFGNSTSNRLKDWLDPDNTGRETLNMLSQETGTLGVTEIDSDTEITVYPIPARTALTVKNTTGKTLTYSLFDVSGRKVDSGELSFQNKVIDVTARNNGVYFLTLINKGSGTQLMQKIVIEK